VVALTDLARDHAEASAALRAVLAEQMGEEFPALAERLREAADALRRGRSEAADELLALLGETPTDRLEPLIQACTLELHLANLAEERERVRRLRERDRDDAPPERESLAETAALFGDRDAAPVGAVLEPLRVELTFTAHPTESMRRSLLAHQRRASELLDRLDDPRLGDGEHADTRRRLVETLTLWWQTEAVRRRRPEVEQEVEATLSFLVDVVYDVVPDLVRELDARFGREPDPRWTPVRFGSWAGGDMDGNPNAGPETLRRSLELHRAAALRALHQRVDRLAARYSQSSRYAPATSELEADLEAHPNGDESRAHEPLRRKLSRIARTLSAMADGEPGYGDPAELAADLALVRGSAHSDAVADGAILRLLRQVACFGFHLAKLDARQSAAPLQAAAEALLDGYADADEEARQRILSAAIDSGDPAPEPREDDEATQRVLAIFSGLASCVEDFGTAAVDTIVISMARDPSDVLCVLWLARAARLEHLRITPLFETIPDLEAAEGTMDVLYANPVYAAHLEALGNRQEIMLGYSDSGKDSGYFASVWALYEVQETLSAQADRHDVEVTFFHGRGGSPSRGGGPAYRSILAQPPGSVRGRIRITEQGEVLSAKYGRAPLGRRSLEQTTSAVLIATAAEEHPDGPAFREEMQRLAERSRTVFRELVYRDADFPHWFSEFTPVGELAHLNIGSRPASRGAPDSVEDLRAIPWVFAWMQNRVVLPSWYGTGTALADGDLTTQREMWRSWPFFQATIGTLEMALFKADLGVADRYRRLVDPALDARLWPQVAAEHERVVDRVLAITEQDELLDGLPALQERLAHRNPWIDPLSHMQVELLARLRDGDEAALAPLLLTVTGIAAGMRNTG
jgi:phosphoenolpyruvate carboxylase